MHIKWMLSNTRSMNFLHKYTQTNNQTHIRSTLHPAHTFTYKPKLFHSHSHFGFSLFYFLTEPLEFFAISFTINIKTITNYADIDVLVNACCVFRSFFLCLFSVFNKMFYILIGVVICFTACSWYVMTYYWNAIINLSRCDVCTCSPPISGTKFMHIFPMYIKK